MLHGKHLVWLLTLILFRLVALLHLLGINFTRIGVHHAGDLLGQLKQVDAVLGVPHHDLLSIDVLQVVH